MVALSLGSCDLIGNRPDLLTHIRIGLQITICRSSYEDCFEAGSGRSKFSASKLNAEACS